MIREDELDVKLKLWLLLADHVIISSGHMIRSGMTYSWMQQNADVVAQLAKENAIIPSLSDKYDSLLHFAYDQAIPKAQSRDEHVLAQEYEGRAKCLDELFPSAITWSSEGESQFFQEMIGNEVKDRRSAIGKRLVGVPNGNLMDLSSAILDSHGFDRGVLLSLAMRYAPRRAKTIIKYGDCCYYMSGAYHKDAFPILHANSVGLCRSKIECDLRRSEAKSDKADFWREIEQIWGLTACQLYHLPVKQLMHLRRSNIGTRARKTWRKLMNKARQNKEEITEINGFQDSWIQLLDFFAKEVDVQRKWRERMYKGRYVFEVSSWITSGVATFLLTGNPAASVGVGIAALIGGRPILDRLDRRIPKTELVLLADCIRRSTPQT